MFKIFVVGTVSAVALCGVAHADVSISNKPTKNMSCVSGVCTPTAKNAVLNVGELQTMLASGDVTVKTASFAKDIEIAQPLSWTSTSRLTLDALQSVVVKKPVTVAGTGALTITTNDGGKDGEFIIVPEHSTIQFADVSSSLVIDGNTYTLVGDIKTLVAEVAANPSGFYALAKPYDASVDGVYSTSPIETLFGGIFEGLGNTISNLSMTASGIQYIGLFSHTSSVGVLRDAVLKNAHVTSSPSVDYSAVGTLAGRIEGSVLRSSSLQGVVSVPMAGGYTWAGGLVGESEGPISSCRANANVSGVVSGAGGLIGAAGYITIQSSSASGSVSGTGYGGDFFGGLIGIGAGEITNSHSTASVNVSQANFVGGIVGLTNGKIESTFSTGSVRVRSTYGYVGGLVGEAYHASIINSYATGKASGGAASAAGGLVGYFGTKKYQGEADLITSYSIGLVRGANYLGGLIGYRKGHPTVTRFDYWDVETSSEDRATGYGVDHGITGLTTEQFKTGLPSGFDPAIWGQSPSINNGYPYLLANPPR